MFYEQTISGDYAAQPINRIGQVEKKSLKKVKLLAAFFNKFATHKRDDLLHNVIFIVVRLKKKKIFLRLKIISG